MKKHYEVADIFRSYGEEYKKNNVMTGVTYNAH